MKFADFERDHRRRLLSGLEWRKFEKGLHRAHISMITHGVQFDHRAGIELAANSHTARQRWFRAFRKHVGGKLGAGEPSYVIREPAYFVTFIDAARSLDDARQPVSTRSLRHHFGEPLQWLNFVGMLEPALYVSLPRTQHPTGKLYVWHLHAIVWGGLREELDALCRAVNRADYRTLIARAQPIQFQEMVPHEFEDVAGYICKSPRSQYSLNPLGNGSMKQYKRKATGANLVRLHRHLQGLHLDHLTLAGGHGKAVLEAMKDDALKTWRQGRRDGQL